MSIINRETIELEQNSFKYLNYIFFLVIFTFVGFVMMCVVLGYYAKNFSDKRFASLFMVSTLCFGLTYFFSSIMLFMSFSYLSAFNCDKYIRLMKLLGFMPLVNICLVYFIWYLKRVYKKQIKEIERNA